MKPVFALRNVTKRFGRQTALDNVSLEAKAGQVIAVLGDNGAGKTTALRILLGLLNADEGQAEVLGMDSRRQGQEIRRRIGYVPDKPAFYEWMTVAEAGWFAAGFYPHGYLEEYSRLVKQFGLPETKKLKHLSRGMQAKVSLSLGMAHRPELLVLDEPTSGLDPIVRREFLESMVDVAAEGRTVLLASHEIHEVERVADSVAILKQSSLATFDRLEVLKTSMQHVLITHADESEFELPFANKVIASHVDGRQSRHLVRGVQDPQIARLRQQERIVEVETRTPSLEEILVGYLTEDAQLREDAPAETSQEIGS